MGRRRPSRRRTKVMLTTARERMDYLFQLAHQEAKKGAKGVESGYDGKDGDEAGPVEGTGTDGGGDMELAHRAVRLARLIGMRYNLRLAPEQKLRQCRHCHAFLWPGRTARVRLRGRKMTVHCLMCGEQNRWGYGKVANKGTGASGDRPVVDP